MHSPKYMYKSVHSITTHNIEKLETNQSFISNRTDK